MGGFVFETARVDMINGLYEIVLSPPTAQGVLVAELRDQEKQLIGKKEIFLDEISRSEVPLHLEPRQPGFQGMVVLDNKTLKTNLSGLLWWKFRRWECMYRYRK